MRDWFRRTPFELLLVMSIALVNLAITQWLVQPYVREQIIALGKYRSFPYDTESTIIMLVVGHWLGRSVGKTAPLPSLPFWHAFGLAAGCFGMYGFTVALYFAGPNGSGLTVAYLIAGLVFVTLLALIGKRLAGK